MVDENQRYGTALERYNQYARENPEERLPVLRGDAVNVALELEAIKDKGMIGRARAVWKLANEATAMEQAALQVGRKLDARNSVAEKMTRAISAEVGLRKAAVTADAEVELAGINARRSVQVARLQAEIDVERKRRELEGVRNPETAPRMAALAPALLMLGDEELDRRSLQTAVDLAHGGQPRARWQAMQGVLQAQLEPATFRRFADRVEAHLGKLDI